MASKEDDTKNNDKKLIDELKYGIKILSFETNFSEKQECSCSFESQLYSLMSNEMHSFCLIILSKCLFLLFGRKDAFHLTSKIEVGSESDVTKLGIPVVHKIYYLA